MPGRGYALEVRPAIPAPIARLGELSENLIYSWDRSVRQLFFELDAALWEACGHNPKLMLRRIAQSHLDAAAQNPDFLQRFQQTLARFDAYMSAIPEPSLATDAPHVAYFCMEFGIHESLGLYSGGLGILAGDYCKAASYGALPFTAVGLMFRQGYFRQRIGSDGTQRVLPHRVEPDELPVSPILDKDGEPLHVAIHCVDRPLHARVWRADVGRVPLYLLDTDTPKNAAADRSVTHQLYGGDRQMRLTQEMVLGVGGLLALRAMGLSPDVWHINEGHPALLILALCREAVGAGLPFEVALEKISASVVFTTHTPVSAGHDRFDPALSTRFLEPLAKDLGVSVERVLALGSNPAQREQFNMTTLALRGSRHCNGVSRIHGEISARMAAHAWPQIEPEENPMQYITNGVHVPTFLAREWSALLDHHYSAWRAHFCNTSAFWRDLIGSIPDHRFWSLRQTLKSAMLRYVADCLERQYDGMNLSRARVESMRRVLCGSDSRALVLGFARRITAYKRPMLLFRDRARLERLLQDPDQPVILIFAGKAHPQDDEGQGILQAINELAAQPPFLGRLFFVEDYNIALARKLVTGVDVWLNTPDYPQEASGTSGQKAAINGVINLSVLDGWWAEGFDGFNGWAIAPHDRRLPPGLRDDMESEELLSLLENEVIPEFFKRDESGMPSAWIRRAKASMCSVLPKFNADRMLEDYMRQIYRPAARLASALAENGGSLAQELCAWKERVRAVWNRVTLRWITRPVEHSNSGEPVPLRVATQLAGLASSDVTVECVLISNQSHKPRVYRIPFTPTEQGSQEQIYTLDLLPPVEGLLELKVRAFPSHSLLAHEFEPGLMVWLE